MLPAELKRLKALELSARKGSPKARHPDECPKLKLKGVLFALPPRGGAVKPTFVDGKITASVSEDADWPEIARFRDAVASITTPRTCPTCNQVVGGSIEGELSELQSVFDAYFALATRALRCQYKLSDEQLADILSFEPSDIPLAFHQFCRWANGLPTEISEAVFVPPILTEPAEAIDTPVPVKRSLWSRLLGRGK